MECEFFCKPGTDLEWFSYYRKDYCENWPLSLGIKKEHLRLVTTSLQSWPSTAVSPSTSSMPSRSPAGELGHCRPHQLRPELSSGSLRKSLEYFDSETNEHYIPYVIEPSLAETHGSGLPREAYDEEHRTTAEMAR